MRQVPSLVPHDYQTHLRRAVAHYWKTLLVQSRKQRSGDADRGRRSAVTGGRQMDGFCDLIKWLLEHNGMPEAHIHVRSKLELPGFFRATKQWDMLVVHNGHLVACLEFKSQRGPSFGNNLNNRTEEALGNATDLWTAYRQGAFGIDRPRPWLGWITLLEECEASLDPVKITSPHFPVFPEFNDTSYSARWELLLRKLVLEKLYDGTAFLLSSEQDGKKGNYREPAADLSMKKFLAALAGHVQTYLASI